MAIDDLPLVRALAQIDAEGREHASDTIRSGVIALGKIISGDFIGAVESLGACHEVIGQERSEFLLRLIVDQVSALDIKYGELNTRHQQYLETEWNYEPLNGCGSQGAARPARKNEFKELPRSSLARLASRSPHLTRPRKQQGSQWN